MIKVLIKTTNDIEKEHFDKYTAKLLLNQSPTRQSDYTVTGQ